MKTILFLLLLLFTIIPSLSLAWSYHHPDKDYTKGTFDGCALVTSDKNGTVTIISHTFSNKDMTYNQGLTDGMLECINQFNFIHHSNDTSSVITPMPMSQLSAS